VAIALAGALAALVLTLVLADPFSPRGVVFGSFQECGLCPAQEATALHPLVGVAIKFVRVGWSREYVAVTDSLGNYSVSLPVGDYLIRQTSLYARGPGEVRVISGQRVEADFIR
jgi:hypothetical protein